MADDNVRLPRRVDGISKKRLLDDFFKVDEYIVNHERFDGEMSGDKRILVFERGDSAAALLYNPFERKVILVNQFRLPTFEKAGSLGWLTETAAGIIGKEIPGETAEQCIIREIQEETGYQVTRLTPVATFFPSPGGSTELIHLFYAEVRAADRESKGGGVEREKEDIKIEEYALPQFLQMLANREFHDAKVIIAGQWLRDRQDRVQSIADEAKPKLFELTAPVEKSAVAQDARALAAGAPAAAAARAGAGRHVGYFTGDIGNVRHVDVWVNPENTDMIMDRFFGRSVSATIRYLGAKKYPDGQRVEEDTIGNALRAAMDGCPFVRPAFVIPTTPGELAGKKNNVKQIFHVAAAFGQIGDGGPTSGVRGPGKGVTTTLKTLEQCVLNVLAEMDRASRWPSAGYRSVIFPIMGTGDGGLFVGEVAAHLVAKAIEYYETHPKTNIRHVFFLAYSAADEAILADLMQDTYKDKLRPVI